MICLNELLEQELILPARWECCYQPLAFEIISNLNQMNTGFTKGKRNRSCLVPDRLLAMNMGDADDSKLNGIETIEPVFGIKSPLGYSK